MSTLPRRTPIKALVLLPVLLFSSGSSTMLESSCPPPPPQKLLLVLGPDLLPTSLEAGSSAPRPVEAAEDLPCDCHPHAMPDGSPGFHALTITADLNGHGSAWPEHPTLRSHRVPPPIRPPRPQTL